MRDYLEHFDSKHVGKLLDQLDDMDVIYTIFPLVSGTFDYQWSVVRCCVEALAVVALCSAGDE
jgi:hypothetical protein